jgi:hypothetical protein
MSKIKYADKSIDIKTRIKTERNTTIELVPVSNNFKKFKQKRIKLVKKTPRDMGDMA